MDKLRSPLLAVATAAIVLAAGGTAGATASAFGNVTCHGGTVRAGTYQSLTIAGACTLTGKGTVTVRGDVTVAAHGVFDAVTPGTLKVGEDVMIGNDAIAGIGCSPFIGCKVTTADSIGGSLDARGAWAVIVHSATIRGNISVRGGGGSMNCASTALFGGPYYDDFEDTTVGGWITVQRAHSCWFGFIRNHVSSNVTITGLRMGDPDANEIVTNWIGGNLACYNDQPLPHVGDSGGSPNVVGGKKLGECRAPGL